MSDKYDFSDLELDWLSAGGKSRGPSFPGAERSAERDDGLELDIDKILADVKKTASAPSEQRTRPVSSARTPAERQTRPTGQADPSAPRQTGTARRVSASGEPVYQNQVRRVSASGEPAYQNQVRRTAASAESAYENQVRRAATSAEPAYESQARRRRGGGSKALLITLIVVLVLGMGFAAWQLGSIFRNYRRDRSAYEELANQAIVKLAEHDEETETPEDTETDPSAPAGQGGAHVVSELPLSVDWEYLRSINSSIVGWLYCPDTVINYPVVQTSDQEFYLKHGFDGNANTSGTLFADPASVPGITQSNYIIYGHNMKDESMFGTFKYYVEKSYYERHPVMYYLTPNGSWRIDLICARVTESYVENLPGYFSSTGDYQAYVNEITSDSFWVVYDKLDPELQLFSMSTCTTASGIEDARFLLYGVMVPIQ